MAGLLANDSEQIDRRTSRSICDAVGERLQQSLRPNRGSRRISSSSSTR
ncbi:hypothetical protein ACQ5SK_40870 [Bradyrhizobium japonicum]